jgi:hypothetical protein
MKNIVYGFRKLKLSVVIILFTSLSLQAQLSYKSIEVGNYYDNETYVSSIAYKLPYRGENYKFYGTLNYHIFGNAFANCNVHNTVVEAFYFCDQSGSEAYYKIARGSGKMKGRVVPLHSKKSGNSIIFMTPQLKNDHALKYYFRTGLFRVFRKYDKSGVSEKNQTLKIDFENTALLILQLDNAAKIYGLEIKKVIINRYFLDELYLTSSGQELKMRDIYFAKYLSKKVNRKYDDLFYIEFERSR